MLRSTSCIPKLSFTSSESAQQPTSLLIVFAFFLTQVVSIARERSSFSRRIYFVAVAVVVKARLPVFP